MKKFFIDVKAQTIELSESFAKKAGCFNSPEYNQLKEATVTYPSYKIQVVKINKKSSIVKGITVDVMRKYIEKHNENDFLNEFDALIENKASYFELKAAVMKRYPQCKTYKTKADWILAA